MRTITVTQTYELIVASVVVAYEIGKRVGTYETQRNYRHPNWRVNPSNQPTKESRK